MRWPGWFQFQPEPQSDFVRIGEKVAQPSPAAGYGGVLPPVPSPGETLGEPAGETPTLQGLCESLSQIPYLWK